VRTDAEQSGMLALRRRPDVRVVSQYVGGQRVWAFKDPISLRYFHLGSEEYALWRMLDGRQTYRQVCSRLRQQFPKLEIRPQDVQSLVARLHRNGLLIAESGGQGARLLERRDEAARRRRNQGWMNLLAIRFRGVDPGAFLDRAYPRLRWLFSKWFLAGCLAIVVAALLLVTVRFGELLSKLPEMRAYFTIENGLMLLATLAVVKILHELGHALAAKHFGGECHEIGPMLLVFTPCLYCNVSDSWMLPARWQRIAIAAAGMAVEVVLAAVATILWWHSEPGVLNSVCFNVMLLCSVGTLLLNGNPLMRYDGYFVLSDLVGVPNLAQRSRDVLRNAGSRLLLGVEVAPTEPSLRSRLGLGCYGWASLGYRLVVLFSIVWLVRQALAPRGLAILADLLLVPIVAGVFVMPMVEAIRLLARPARRRRLRHGRAAVAMLIALALLAAAACVPIPRRVSAPVTMEAAGAQRVYVTQPGKLQRCVAAGQQVEQGEQLAHLVDRQLDLELERLQGERDRRLRELESLVSRQGSDPASAQQIPAARRAWQDIESRLAQRKRDAAARTLVAPCDGEVLPPPKRNRDSSSRRLPTWQGTPLQPKNRGAYLETGTLLCLVGDAEHVEAIATIPLSDVGWIEVGQAVEIKLHAFAAETLTGTVLELAEIETEDASTASLSSPEQAGGPGQPRLPSQSWQSQYRARIQLDPHALALRLGSRGTARIRVAPQTLGQRLVRYLQRTFRFRW